MKKLIALIATAAFSSSAASADVAFDPAFTGSSVPSGYTEVDKAGGSVTYSPGNMVSSDFSVSGSQSYITATSASGSESLTTDFTFTPSYTADSTDFGYPNPGTQATANILDLFTSGGSNRPILEVTFSPDAYGPNDQVDVGGDIGYGGATSVGASQFELPGVNSLNGVALTVNLVTTLTNLGANVWQITDVGTISDGSTSTPIDLTLTGTATSSYDPINNPLVFEAGITPGTYGGGAGPGAAGFLSSGATIDFSNISVATTTPEPSTVGLMLGGLGLLIVMIRRRIVA